MYFTMLSKVRKNEMERHISSFARSHIDMVREYYERQLVLERRSNELQITNLEANLQKYKKAFGKLP